MRRLLIVSALASASLAGARGSVAEADPWLERARALLARHPVADGHNDLPWALRREGIDASSLDLRAPSAFETDLPRLRRGGVGLQLWSVYVPAGAGARTQLEQIDLARTMIARHPEDLALALSADEAIAAMERGRIASMLAMEGGHAIEGSLALLRAFHALGVRSMTLTHSKTTEWADSSGDAGRHGGLSRFGEQVVREMNRLGMLVDLSHASDATAEDALRIATAPVVFTHSSARALCDAKRNVPDAILRAVARNGGVVMVTFAGVFVSAEARRAHAPAMRAFFAREAAVKDPAERRRMKEQVRAAVRTVKVTVAQVADHVEHVRKVAGVDHVGVGGDYDGTFGFPEGMEDVSGYPALFAELARRGWSDEDLAKLASGNFLRVLRAVEEAARTLREAG